MILFECFADEAFLRFLGSNSSQLSGGHSSGRSNVSKRLQKKSGFLGVIDEDPGAAQDSYLKRVFATSPVYSDDYISYVEADGNRLLIIRPDLEGLTIKLAKDKNIDLKKFGLSMERSTLHSLLRV